MSFLISFRSELLKTRRTSTWYLGILVALFLPVIFFIDYAYQDDIVDKVAGNPWTIFIKDGFLLFNMLILPLYVLLTTTLLPQMEYRNNAWKQMLVSPQPLWHIYLARYGLVILLIAVFILLHNIFMMMLGALMSIGWPEYHFSEYRPDVPLILKSSMHSMVCTLGFSAIEFWIGWRYRNFIVPLAAGFGFWIVANVLTFELHLPYAEFNPFTYLAHASFSKYEPKIVQVMLSSMGCCMVFLVLGYMNFDKKRVR